MTDAVNHPSHYGGNTVYEVIKVLEAKLTHDQFVGFLRGNAIKYLMRAGRKTATTSEDLRKAEFYTKYEIDYAERRERGFVGEARVAMRADALGGKSS